MKIKLACGITKQLEKEFLISNFEYFKDYFQSSIYKNEDEANLDFVSDEAFNAICNLMNSQFCESIFLDSEKSDDVFNAISFLQPVNFENLFLAVMKKEFRQRRNSNNFICLVKLAKLNEILEGLYSKNPYFKSLRKLLSSVENLDELEDMFSISIQLRNKKINIEEVLKDENPDTHDYIYRIKSEFIQGRTSFCFIRYKYDSNSENPIFDDDLKKFQIYKKGCFESLLLDFLDEPNSMFMLDLTKVEFRMKNNEVTMRLVFKLMLIIGF